MNEWPYLLLDQHGTLLMAFSNVDSAKNALSGLVDEDPIAIEDYFIAVYDGDQRRIETITADGEGGFKTELFESKESSRLTRLGNSILEVLKGG